MIAELNPFWLFLIIVIGATIWALSAFFWHNSSGPAELQARRKASDKAKSEADWRTHCERLDGWFKVNQQAFSSCPLNIRQQKILYAIAEHGDFHDRLKLWQLMILWGWDGTSIDRLRFDVDFEQLQRERLIAESGGGGHLSKEERAWFLTVEGRDYLMKHHFI